jgi:hypothetical protein
MSVHSPSLKSLNSSAQIPEALRTTLLAATRRIRALLLLRFIARTLCVTSVAALLVLGLSKLRLFEMPSPWSVGALLGLGVLCAVVLAFLRPLTALDVARLTERRADLKERLSSAVEFQQRNALGAESFYDALLADADRHAAGLDVRALYPLRIPRSLPVGMLCALALFLFYYLPTLPMFWSPQMKQEMAEVKRQGIQIEKLAKDTTKTADQQKLDETKKAAAEAQKLGEAMHKGELNKKQALVSMQKLTRKMEEAQKRLAASLPAKPMEQAQSEFKRSLDKMQQDVEAEQQKRAAQAQQAAKNQQAKNGQKPGDKNNALNQNQHKPESEAMKQARKALEQMQQAMQQQNPQQMQQAMQQMAQQMQSGQMSPEEMQQMAQAMQQMAQALQNTEQYQSSQMLQQLSQMMQQNQGKIDPNTLQQMAQMMRNIGQSMGHCNGNGKGMMDAKMLQQLAEALKNGRLSMCMGTSLGKGPGQGRGGKGPGKGFNGSGGPFEAMKDPGNKAQARLLAQGQDNGKTGIGKSGSAQEFAKYLGQASKGSKYLPNGKIAGTRSRNGQELQQYMTGDPEAFKGSSPYYQAYQTNRRAAESALNKENIPAAYKKQVRDYFDSIQP